MLLTLYLTSLAVDTTAPAARRAPQPEIEAPRPAIVVHRQPAVPLVALRLSVVANDPPGLAGTGHLLQHLLEGRLREQVARVGGRIRLERTSDALVFMVSGPAGELGYLARVLRSALEPPRFGEAEVLRAGRALAEERLAEWETASTHVRAVLRARLFPEDLPPAGTEAAARRLDSPAEVADAWSRLYRPELVSVVAVGDVGIGDVEAAFGDLPAAGRGGAAPVAADTAVARALAAPQATRGWVAAGHPASELPPAAVMVAARLTGDALRQRLPEATVDAEHWWTHHGQAIVVVAAVPGSGLSEAEAAVGGALSRARGDLTAARVAAAARAVRRDFLFYSRTIDRMADVLGRFADRNGDPDAAQRFYAQLDAVRIDHVREAMDRMLDRPAARVTVPPQRLPER